MSVLIVDTADDTTSVIRDLVRAGVTTVGRYDSSQGHWKEASNAEVSALLAAGLHVFMFNENNNNHAGYFSYNQGYNDACYSLARAFHRNQPDGSAIYYTVDYDATVNDINNVICPFFDGVKQAHSENRHRWQIGCYGSGLTCDTLLKTNRITLSCITCSGGFAGSKAFVNAGKESLWQYACDRDYFGLSADFLLSPTGRFGQWPASAEPGIVAGSGWQWGPSIGKASWYDDGENADGQPVHPGDMTFASTHVPFGTRVRITRLDDSTEPWNLKTICGGEKKAETHGQISTIGVCTDRGPYAHGRIIDLRPALAKALGFGPSYGAEDPGVVAVSLELAA